MSDVRKVNILFQSMDTISLGKKKRVASGYLKDLKKKNVKTKIKLRTQAYTRVFLGVGKFRHLVNIY